jgi:hypothetical protein
MKKKRAVKNQSVYKQLHYHETRLSIQNSVSIMNNTPNETEQKSFSNQNQQPQPQPQHHVSASQMKFLERIGTERKTRLREHYIHNQKELRDHVKRLKKNFTRNVMPQQLVAELRTTITTRPNDYGGIHNEHFINRRRAKGTEIWC